MVAWGFSAESGRLDGYRCRAYTAVILSRVARVTRPPGEPISYGSRYVSPAHRPTQRTPPAAVRKHGETGAGLAARLWRPRVGTGAEGEACRQFKVSARSTSMPEPAASEAPAPSPDDDGPLPEDSGLVGASGAFAPGSSVMMTGLQSQPALNGQFGVVRGFSEDKGRYTVDVAGRERAVRLKPENVFIPAVPADRSGTSQDFVIDITSFMNSTSISPAAERRLVAASWDATFRSIGFARIVGHGVSPDLISELRSAARAFFLKPESEKMPYHRPAQPGQPVIGSFNPLFGSRVPGGHNDPVEGYTFYRQHDGWPLSAPELSHPPELAAVAERYCVEVERVMHALHRLSAASLGLHPAFFDSTPGTKLSSLLVLSHYPPIDKLSEELEVEDGQPRYRAHSDYTGFTILLQDEEDHDPDTGAGGLEIDLAGNWMPVSLTFELGCFVADSIATISAHIAPVVTPLSLRPTCCRTKPVQVMPRPNSFVINIGDLFELWTNNRWRSTPHRVSSPRVGTPAASRSRITAMLFSGPSLETMVGPAPTCGPSLYPTVTARQHLTAMAMTKSKEAQYKKAEAAKTAASAGPKVSPDV